MKLSLLKIIAIMAVLISGVLLLTSRGCSVTKLATTQKPETITQPGTPTGSSSAIPREQGGDDEHINVTDWDSHNLVLLGENFIPVGDAFSTPFATFFRIDEDGYIPSTSLGKVNTDGPCQKKWYAPSRPAGVNIAPDSAVEASATPTDGRTVSTDPDCPRDLGRNLDAGSYVFDKDGNDLAGFDFQTNPHLYEVFDQHSRRYLVFPEGGKGPANNPAVKKMKLETLLVDASVYPKEHDHDEAMKDIQNLIPGSQETEIKYLPTKSSGQTQQELEDALVEAVQKEIEALVERLNKKIRAAVPDTEDSILVGVRMSNFSSAELAEQQQRIKAKIIKALETAKANVGKRIIIMHFGSELPACAIALSSCRAINTSVALYSGPR